MWLFPLLLPLQPLSRFLQGTEVRLSKGAGLKIWKQQTVWWGPCSVSGSAGGRGSPTRGLQLGAVDGSISSPPPIPPTLGGEGWVDGLTVLDIPGLVWDTQLGIAQKGFFPVGGRLSFFLPAWQRITLDKFCPGGYQTGVLPPFCEASPIVFVPCGDTVAQAAVQTTSAVGRGFITPIQGGRGNYRSVSGPGGILFPLFPGHQAQPQLVYSSCQVPHGDPHLHSSGSSQRLVDGVAGSLGRLLACDDTPQSLAVPSVCSQEPRGAHCLPMEDSPFWLSHCPEFLPTFWLP